MTVETKREELERLQTEMRRLENEMADEAASAAWQATGYYTAYYATTGFMLGLFGAAASLLFNIVGSVMVGQHPLEIIRCYLTFPLGDRAFEIETGLGLAVGCCLYLGTGMLLGVPMYLALTRFTAQGTFAGRLAVASVVAVVIWLVNFYGVLAWLQPLVVKNISESNLIVNRVPPWVAALTHLVFGWTMVLVYPLGLYSPYRRETDKA